MYVVLKELATAYELYIESVVCVGVYVLVPADRPTYVSLQIIVDEVFSLMIVF